ncbi:hypothetical protein LCGC14_3158260, partial [marine sediment metagenome]
SLGLCCTFCDEIKEPLAEIGGFNHTFICRDCMVKRPSTQQQLAFVRTLIGDGLVELHSSYIMEKVEIALNCGSLDYLIGCLDLPNQRKFMRELGL